MKTTYLPILAGVAASAFALNAQATIITAYAGTGLTEPTTVSWDFSKNAASLLTLTAPTSITAVGGATAAISSSVDPRTGRVNYSGLSFAAPLLSATFDTASNNKLLTEQLGGGLTITSGRSDAGTGGSLTISNLTLDFTKMAVTATLTGANGVGSHEGINLFYFDNLGDVNVNSGLQYVPEVAPSAPISPYYGYPQDSQSVLVPFLNMNQVPVSIPSMYMSAEGLGLWSASLGYSNLGSSAVKSVLSFGTINSPAVPEASTWTMTSLGLISLLAVARRKSPRLTA